jgi:hypothetical protein
MRLEPSTGIFDPALTFDLVVNLHFSQQSLDGIVVHQPRAPAFTTSGLLDYVVELIVCENKVRLYHSSSR